MSVEITLPVSELKQALPGFGKVITKSRTLPVLQSVRVQRNDQGTVTLEGTDLDSHLAYRLKDAQPGEPASVLVPFDTLSKTAKGSAETLTLIPDGKDKVRLRYHIGNSPVEQRISTPELKEWPEAPRITSPAVPLAKDFGPTLKEALQCSSDDRSRVILNSAHVDVSDKKAHYIVGTNGRVLYSANSFCFDLKESVTIPNLKFFGWAGFHAEDCRLALHSEAKNQSRWLQLQSGPWTVTARQVEGMYPNWRQVVPADTSQGATVKLDAEAIGQILKVVPQLPGGDSLNSPLRLSLANGRLQVEGKHNDSPEWTQISIEGATVSGSAVQISLNREYLLQALRCGLDQIAIRDALSPLLFSQGGRKLVVMPLRPEADPTPAAKVASTASAPVQAAEKPTETTQPTEKEMTKETKDIKPETQESALQAALTRIESLRDTLKNTVRDLTEVFDALKAAEKEHRSVQKEFDNLRAKLRSLQNINL